ncbi:hypothetical protein [Marinobacter confluentis]|uniref:Uncharacterized protein n=1 Tax=Marinobacter confluentis TaxID=1697557 RepID=A0A4Z1C7R9_9GAMM|nr:hypothetical protein [Marinobacter confluentis]TGN41670.1 hypothetical protein E5Q11_03840 [Marinobacter confluentis]
MITGLVFVLELGLLSLLLLLAFRMLSLNRREPLMSSASPGYTSSPAMPISREKASAGRCELISQLHILASLQARDCKQQGFDVDSAHLAVREYAVCWLYGAASALSHPGQRNSDVLAGLVSQFAGRKLGIRQSEAVTVISTLTRNPVFLACFRSGIEGAEYWKTHHFVPRNASLFEAVTSNAFV